jgi:hypothetical protein
MVSARIESIVSMRRAVSLLVSAIMVGASTVAALVVGELVVRHVDGYSLGSIALAARPDRPDSAPYENRISRIAASRHAAAVKSVPELDPRWFEEEPPPLPNRKRPNRYLRDIMAGGKPNGDLFKLWNAQYVRTYPDRLKGSPGFVYVFVPTDESMHPPFRFFPNSTSPSGLVTNAFAFRGPPIELDKPHDVIRIAFLGSSATSTLHNYPFSYPELVGFWLNRWAEATKLGVRFETINAGREGIDSQDIAKVFVDEVVPLRPDLAVYYEGGNEFNLSSLTSPPLQLRTPGPSQPSRIQRDSSRLHANSAIWRRIAGQALGEILKEGPRPTYTLNWPVGVDKLDPDITSPNLPLNLPNILKHLDVIHAAAQAADAEMILSSFKWLVSDDIALDPARHNTIHQFLEQYPWHYSDMRALADFQNRVLERYADQHGVDFLDISRLMPDDPDLFTDAVHKTYYGEKLHAWIVVGQLIPKIRQQLRAGRLPKRSPPPVAGYPMWAVGVAKMELARTPKADVCRGDTVGQVVDLATVTAASEASIESGDVLTIRTGAPRWLYAAEAPLPIASGQNAETMSVLIEYEVLAGEVGFGILSPDKSRFIVHRLSEAGPSRTITLTPTSFRATGSQSLWLIVNNASGGGPSVVRIRSIKLCHGSTQSVDEALEPIGGGTFGSLAAELAGQKK